MFHQSCHVTKASVSLNWHQSRQTCRVLRKNSASLSALISVSSSRMLKECVLPPAMCRRRRVFAMMHLRNFCQVFIDEVRQEMTRSPVKVPLSTETVKGVGWRLETIGVTHPLWKFSGYATVMCVLIGHCAGNSNYRHRQAQHVPCGISYYWRLFQ